MQYFTDGLTGLIRVYTAAPLGSKDFFFAKAEKLGADGNWFEKPKLMFELLNSGYYEPATEDEVDQMISAMTAPALTPDELLKALQLAGTFSSTSEIVEDPEVSHALASA
jgi:hypothetical protein